MSDDRINKGVFLGVVQVAEVGGLGHPADRIESPVTVSRKKISQMS